MATPPTYPRDIWTLSKGERGLEEAIRVDVDRQANAPGGPHAVDPFAHDAGHIGLA